MNEGLFWALLALTLVTLLVAAWTAVALGRLRTGDAQAALDAQLQRKEIQDLRSLLQTGNERMERELRRNKGLRPPARKIPRSMPLANSWR